MVKLKKRFRFGSKAETLTRLQNRLTKCKVPEFLYFSLSDWASRQNEILDEVQAMFGGGTSIIARSSALSEDSELYAQAGAFLSVAHIDPNGRDAIRDAVNGVFASYQSANDGATDDDQILVQRMVSDVSMSGVVFTQVLSSGAPYYVVNYDDETGSTDSVTSGTGYANRTLYIYRNDHSNLDSPRFKNLLAAVEEVENLTEDGCLDIEFALDSDLNVHLFQVRRITTQPNWSRGLSLRIGDAIDRLRKSVGPRLIQNTPQPEEGTVLGKMPDWNPAEIIGNAPRRLAFSTYRHLITDSAWRRARARMGYFEPRGMPLMESCAGQPYINVRHSFRSFLPADLSPALADRLVDHWIGELAENKQLHDKVEFSVAVTSWSFDFLERSEKLLPNDLTPDERAEVRDTFKRLTFDLVTGQKASLQSQVDDLHELERRYDALASDDGHSPSVGLVSQLMEDAIEYGTVPFSILARHGFIARQLLFSLVAEGLLSDDDVDRFNQSITTVAGEFITDMHRYAEGELSQDKLFERYGHLRPGTYDILSLRYDQRGPAVLGERDETSRLPAPVEKAGFRLDTTAEAAIAKRLKDEGLMLTPTELFEYCAQATKGREWAKFVFTRSVSDGLEVIAAWGEQQGLSREELSHIDIRDILDCLVECRGRSIEEHLRQLSERGRLEHEVTSGIRLPYLIARPSDFHVVPMLLEEPNFITLNQVSGPCCLVGGRDFDPEILDGHIVVIESADPGFDWIFSRPIKGLVTKFGGANSHMAIRCAEFGIPAAIGCGEQIFERVIKSQFVEIDCAVGTIQPVGH